MRVISQDGTKDFPYDNAWVSVYEGWHFGLNKMCCFILKRMRKV